MTSHIAGRVSEIPEGSRRLIDVAGKGGVGVFHVGSEFFALRNSCPHQGGPLCLGAVTGTSEVRWNGDGPALLEWVREGEILRCPWHRWEFDLRTGQSVFRSKMRVSTYEVRVAPSAETFPVRIEDGLLVVEIP
ncbi:MAG TPA: Rieske (2Fe-2S) protein [Candidatus Acidoferrales bacterium]|nr:Rieske (2Fe-2S) protein [Candidatus Acidoferrales bacterium]